MRSAQQIGHVESRSAPLEPGVEWQPGRMVDGFELRQLLLGRRHVLQSANRGQEPPLEGGDGLVVGVNALLQVLADVADRVEDVDHAVAELLGVALRV